MLVHYFFPTWEEVMSGLSEREEHWRMRQFQEDIVINRPIEVVFAIALLKA